MTEHKKHIKGAKDAVTEKSGLHPRNPHRGRYDFGQLIASTPELAAFVAANEYGDESIDFTDPLAVKALNRALLQQMYDIVEWDIPAQYLCPPIPGRADYLHYVADLLAEGGDIPRGPSLRVLDVGVGANCVYPLIGQRAYGWQFVGSDIDPVALANAKRIVDANHLSDAIELRLQRSVSSVFSGVLQPNESFDLSLCNPPFHASLDEARAGTQRKWRNLGKPLTNKSAGQPVLNFGGQGAELCCEGGEEAFVSRMVAESARYPDRCLWFTTLISKSTSLPGVYRALERSGAWEWKTQDVAQGQKKSRIVAWTFLDEAHRREWRLARWK